MVRLLGAMFLSLPPFRRAQADAAALAGRAGGVGTPVFGAVSGAASAGGGGGGDAAGGVRANVDPVAERRREKALAALDRKLAEMRSTMRPASALQGGAGTPVAGAALLVGATSPVPDMRASSTGAADPEAPPSTTAAADISSPPPHAASLAPPSTPL